MPNSGKYRQRGALQKRGPQVTDAEGNTPDNWIDVMDIWFNIAQPSVLAQAASGREEEIAAQFEQRLPHLLLMRGNLRFFIDHNCRILYGGRTVPPARVFDVLTVTDIGEMHIELSVQVMEILSGDTTTG